jgi:hypothetical protein
LFNTSSYPGPQRSAAAAARKAQVQAFNSGFGPGDKRRPAVHQVWPRAPAAFASLSAPVVRAAPVLANRGTASHPRRQQRLATVLLALLQHQMMEVGVGEVALPRHAANRGVVLFINGLATVNQ